MLSNYNFRLIPLVALITCVVIMQNIAIKPMPVTELNPTTLSYSQVSLVEFLTWSNILIGIYN